MNNPKSIRLNDKDLQNIESIKHYLENNIPFCFAYDNPTYTEIIKFALSYTARLDNGT